MQTNIIHKLVGETIDRVVKKKNKVLDFIFQDGRIYRFFHDQDCCECVLIEDICGDLDDLQGSPILVAEERVGDRTRDSDGESSTWTFYEFRTIKGSVTVRWYGTSNGYYAENVDHGFVETDWRHYQR